MSKKILVLLCLVCILTLVLAGCSVTVGENIITNGNFEEFEKNNVTGWSKFQELKGENDSQYYEFNKINNVVNSDDYNARGASSMSIAISNKNTTAYYSQKVKLVNGKKYKLSYDINIESTIKGAYSNADKFVGAYIGFLEDETFIRKNNIKNTTEGWQTREIYFESKIMGTTQLVAGLGHELYGGAKGTVKFDNIKIEAVDTVPVGKTLDVLKPGSSVPESEIGGVTYTVIGAFFGIFMLFGGFMVARVLLKKQGIGNELEEMSKIVAYSDDNAVKTKIDNSDAIDINPEILHTAPKLKKSKTNTATTAKKSIGEILTSPVAMFIYVLVSCFAVRFLFMMLFNGMSDKLAELGKIALAIADDGPSKLYAVSTTTLPTGMLYLLYAIGGIAGQANISYNSVGMTMLLRIPNIIADLVICYLIFIFLNKHYNHKYSAIFAGIYALMPMMFTASGLWGLNISLPLAFALGMLYCMVEKKYIGVSICYLFGLLFSHSLLVLLPLFVAYIIYYCIKDKKAILPLVVTSLIGFVVYYCLAIPFTIDYFSGDKPEVGIFMVFNKILVDMQLNVLITNSTFDFYAIFGLGAQSSNVAITVVTAILMAIFISGGVFLYIKSKNRLDILLLGALSAIIYTVFGVGARIEVMAIGIIMLLVYAGVKGEKRVFNIVGILSILAFVNMATLLTKSGYINIGDALANAGYVALLRLDPIFIIGSILTTLTTIYLIYVSYDIMYNGLQSEIKPMSDNWFKEVQVNVNNKCNNIKRIFTRK